MSDFEEVTVRIPKGGKVHVTVHRHPVTNIRMTQEEAVQALADLGCEDVSVRKGTTVGWANGELKGDLAIEYAAFFDLHSPAMRGGSRGV